MAAIIGEDGLEKPPCILGRIGNCILILLAAPNMLLAKGVQGCPHPLEILAAHQIPQSEWLAAAVLDPAINGPLKEYSDE